jgi:hypothetical protein
MENRIKEISDILESAISYEDWKQVDDARKELLFLLDELETDFPLHNFEEDF